MWHEYMRKKNYKKRKEKPETAIHDYRCREWTRRARAQCNKIVGSVARRWNYGMLITLLRPINNDYKKLGWESMHTNRVNQYTPIDALRVSLVIRDFECTFVKTVKINHCNVQVDSQIEKCTSRTLNTATHRRFSFLQSSQIFDNALSIWKSNSQ